MDIFRPHTEPAATLYDAFQEEAKNRSKYEPKEWILNERKAVWKAAINYSCKNELYVPTLIEVEDVEKQAYGSADYGSKWAIKLANLILEKSNVYIAKWS